MRRTMCAQLTTWLLLAHADEMDDGLGLPRLSYRCQAHRAAPMREIHFLING